MLKEKEGKYNRMLSIRDLPLTGKRVLIRVDLNVPLNEEGIADDSRLRAIVPTVQYARSQGGRVILMSHLGRPEGRYEPHLSLRPCAAHLSTLLGIPVSLAPDCCGPITQEIVAALKPGEVLLLENLRFHLGEEEPEREPTFAPQLAALGDLYIQEAFGAMHRAHASITEITHFFPGKAAIGFLVEREIAYLDEVLHTPRRPLHALLGGAKVSTKFKVIQTLLAKADVVLIGGAMAHTFFLAQGIPMGDSLVENRFMESARALLEMPVARDKLLLPVDLVVTNAAHEIRTISIEEGVPIGYRSVDIGPRTIKYYGEVLQSAATLFWNGPLGLFETPPFNRGTEAIAHLIARLPHATTIVGGGDSLAAVHQAGVADRFTHLSTGGGASLEYIEQGHLPGLDALSH